MSALHLFTSKGNRFAFIASLCISILALLFITPVKPAFAAQSVIVTVGNPNGGNLAGAYVSANGGMSGGCTTNSLGSCSINLPSPGNYTIRASYGSYIPASVYRYFGAGQTISIRLNLSWGDGTGGPAPTTPPAQPTVSPLTTAYTCVYRNGQLLSSATVQLSGYAEVATGDGCHTYTIYKNQTIYITARANGQVKSQSVYVGMPALSTPPKVSGTPPGTGQTLPKQINVSIKRSNGALHTELVTISLKNTSTGQVTTRSTTSGYYAFTNLLGGSYPYEVGASLSNVSPYNISGPQAFTLGSGTKEVTFAVLPKNPGITKTPPTLAPNTTVNVTVTVKRGTNVVDKASVYICKAGASGTGNVTCPNGTTDSQGKVTLKVAANTAYTVEASQATSVGKVNLTTSTTSRGNGRYSTSFSF